MTIGEPKPCEVISPADEYWPAYVEEGYIIHSEHDADGNCNPYKCCIVRSLDGLVTHPEAADDEEEE